MSSSRRFLATGAAVAHRAAVITPRCHSNPRSRTQATRLTPKTQSIHTHPLKVLSSTPSCMESLPPIARRRCSAKSPHHCLRCLPTQRYVPPYAFTPAAPKIPPFSHTRPRLFRISIHQITSRVPVRDLRTPGGRRYTRMYSCIMGAVPLCGARIFRI